MAKKNPIKKREQGSQKPNPNTPGNPKKYMGDAEWEQYNEPQGVNSPAAKRIMKKESFSSMVDRKMKETFGGMDGDLGMMSPARMAPDKIFTDPITDPQSFEKIGNAKAPTKTVKRTVKKSYQDKDFEKELAEMVRVPVYTLISGDYEVRAKEKRMGHARVVDGVIAELICSDSNDESYRGEVLTNLLKTIIEEADLQNSPLSLQLADRDDEDMKRFLERFGFRAIGHGVMQRAAGAVSPPSVQYTDGMEDEELDR